MSAFVLGVFVISANLAAVAIPVRTVEKNAVFTQLELHPNIETVGILVRGAGLPKTAELLYRRSGEVNWRTGHPLMRLDDGRLAGSLFGLSPATAYEIRVLDGSTEISGATTTQPDELAFTPLNVLHVDDNASAGGDGSLALPFQTIQEGVNKAAPGTQVLVADGVYHEAVSFPASGTTNNWIQVKAAGNAAVLDGSDLLGGDIWQPHDRARVWFTKISGPITYLARDGKRFYMYDDLPGLLNAIGHNKVPMNEGWYLERSTLKLYVRSMDNPANHAWQAPRFNYAFENNGQDWIWVEGFEMRFYGAQTGGCGVCATNASHLVVRKNRIHNMQLGVYTNWTGGDERGNDIRIESNEIYDPTTSAWPWSAVKGSSMENTAIVLRGHSGAIVRGNDLHHYFNGIYTGSSGALENSALAFDADIYNNRIHDIADDAFEPEGACINQRFRNNTVDASFVGLSFAPVTQGPVWVLRSTFANYSGRAIKWDRDSDGIVLVYHNTFWTSFQNVTAMEMISTAHNSVLRNNIFQGNGYAIYEVRTGSTSQDWNYDNWYGGAAAHFKWENKDYPSVTALCAATSLECNGHESDPALSNPASGDFTLRSSSPNIDRGIAIPGINDTFSGSAPDIGAFEQASAVDPPPAVLSITRADPNPTGAASVNFTVTFSEAVTGVDSLPPFNDFSLSSEPGLTGAFIVGVTAVSSTTYTVNVNTGSGNGAIRLDLVDNNSIADFDGNPLGGPNPGDGSFANGESYTVEKTAPSIPFVTSVLRADPNPTAADLVSFTVNFSEPVSGIDPSDFFLTKVGNLPDAVITHIDGSGITYLVAVGLGGGDGGLRLDVLDDDSILSATGTPLGGAGAGNGAFTSGEAYTVDKTAPRVTAILRADANPTAAASVNFTVVFSEPVSGVDVSDFSLTTTGSISGAGVGAVNGSGYLYTVSAGTGSGDGTLRLDVLDNDSILDASNLALAGPGIGNGNFTTGEEFTIKKTVITLLTVTIRSNGKNDGWVLESGKTTNKGGSLNSKNTTFILGDDKQDRQYRSILDFPTDLLPDNAVVTKAMLLIKGEGLAGTNPFTTHQIILVDIRSGSFGNLGPFANRGLQTMDFQSASSRDAVGVIQNNPYYGWYWTWLDSSSFQYLNLTGITQFRLRFQLDDNDDRGNDYLRFFSGDANNVADRPQLVIEYYLR
jgi:hypothetical protein